MGLSLYVILVFSLADFTILPLFCVFGIVIIMCHVEVPPLLVFFIVLSVFFTSIGVSFFRGSYMILLKVFFCAFDLWQSPSPIRITHWFDLFKASQTLLYFVPKFFDKIKLDKTKPARLDKVFQQKEKRPKNRYMNQRPNFLHAQETH